MSKLGDILKDIAPTIAGVLGTATGGPLVGVALKTLSERVLGHPNGSQDEVATAIQGLPPDKVLELRKLDIEYKEKMMEAGYKEDELVTTDIQSARDMYNKTQNPMTNWLAGGIVVSAFGMAAAIISGHASGLKDPTMAATAGTVVGFIFRELKHVLQFFFGFLKDSKDAG